MHDAAIYTLLYLIFPAAMAFAATSDLVSMTISNRLQLLLMISFGILAVLLQLDWAVLINHLLAFAAILIIAFFCFARGWIGGGDAKLAACTALWFGFTPQLYDYLLISGVFGGALTLGLLYARSLTLPSFLANQGWIAKLHDDKTGIPYGIALAAGALVVYPNTKLFLLGMQ